LSWLNDRAQLCDIHAIWIWVPKLGRKTAAILANPHVPRQTPNLAYGGKSKHDVFVIHDSLFDIQYSFL